MSLMISHIVLQLDELIFFFNDTATTEIYTLSLHDALPISLGLRLRLQPVRQDRARVARPQDDDPDPRRRAQQLQRPPGVDRKSTRLNSSHGYISYAVFCLQKKKEHLPRQCVRYEREADCGR